MISLLSVGSVCFLPACGTANSKTPPAGSYLKSDGDIDTDGPGKLNDDYTERGVAGGREASNSIRPAIVRTIREYYAAAAANDGSKTCALLDPPLAAAIAEEPNRLLPSSSKTCATSVSLLLKQQHQTLSTEEPSTMVVIAVRIFAAEGMAILGFRKVPEAEIPLQRVGNVWKINSLFDGPLP